MHRPPNTRPPGPTEENALLRERLEATLRELDKTSSELLQLTLELDDRVEARTRALRESEAELRLHRDKLESLVHRRTEELRKTNSDLQLNLARLQASEARFESLVRTVPDIVYRIDPDGHFIFVNDAVERLGYAPRELIGRHFSCLIRPIDNAGIDRPALLPSLAGITTGNAGAPKLVDERRTGERKTTGLVVELKPKTESATTLGLLRSVAEQVVAEINSAGIHAAKPDSGAASFLGTVGVIRDITERRRIEHQLKEAYAGLEERVIERTRELTEANEQLRRSESSYRILFDNAADIIMLVGLDGSILDMNETGLGKYGYTREQILGMKAWELMSSGQQSHFPERMRRIVGEGTLTVDSEHIASDGRVFPVEVRINVVELEAGKACLTIARDMSARVEAEFRLKKSHELLQSILEGLGAAVFYVDPARYEIIGTNPVGEKLLGLPREEIVGRSCCSLICPEKLAVPGKNCPLYGSKFLNIEKTLELPDGRRIPIVKNVLSAEIDSRPHTIEILFDMSERKELERRLAISQKLESVGQLAAGIAHEINTPIQYISGNIDFIGLMLGDITRLLTDFARAGEADSPEERDELFGQALAAWRTFQSANMVQELADAIGDSRKGTGQIADIVQAMKRFSHPGSEQKSLFDLNASIESAVIVSRNEWKYSSRLTTALSPDLPLMHGYPGDINQLILNIIINAAHANEAKHSGRQRTGKILVSTSHEDGRIVLRIADNGAGIPRAIRDKIFDPFFTTKEVGKGTGQGLAIVHSIVSKHGGVISFTSAEGEGTTFEISFPTDNEEPKKRDDVTETNP